MPDIGYVLFLANKQCYGLGDYTAHVLSDCEFESGKIHMLWQFAMAGLFSITFLRVPLQIAISYLLAYCEICLVEAGLGYNLISIDRPRKRYFIYPEGINVFII